MLILAPFAQLSPSLTSSLSHLLPPPPHFLLHLPPPQSLIAKVLSHHLTLKNLLLPSTFSLHVSPPSKTLLNLTTTALPPDLVLGTLGVEEVYLRRRAFADSPGTA